MARWKRLRYLPTANGSGHLVYTKNETLFAVPFDLDRLEGRGTAGGGSTAQGMTTIQWLTPTTGGPVPRADGAGDPQPLTGTKTNQAPLSITSDGKRLAYSEYAGHAQIWTVPLEETNGQIKAAKPEQWQLRRYMEGVEVQWGVGKDGTVEKAVRRFAQRIGLTISNRTAKR